MKMATHMWNMRIFCQNYVFLQVTLGGGVLDTRSSPFLAISFAYVYAMDEGFYLVVGFNVGASIVHIYNDVDLPYI